MNKTQFSIAAFVLALGFWFYQFTTQSGGNFGMQFRYLTIWGLSFAVIAHYLLWRDRSKGHRPSYPAFITGTAVLNIMVVFLYWRLYFIDPKLVNGDNTPVWFQEYSSVAPSFKPLVCSCSAPSLPLLLVPSSHAYQYHSRNIIKIKGVIITIISIIVPWSWR